MSDLSSNDRAIWGGLIAVVLNPKVGPSQIRGKARRTDKAMMPEGFRDVDGCFMRLNRVGKALQPGDPITREFLCDFAHECLRALGGRLEGKTVVFSAASSVEALPSREKPVRKDIDG